MTERSIFLAALDIADPAQRAAYLGQACGHDAALRQHVEELIAAEAKLGGFLNRPHAAVELTHDLNPVTERPGSQIGHYKLLEQIGEGGFGVVFMAEQLHPVRRKVALKVLKAGMDTRQVIARFEAERQALALMDHPNIARVLDAGETTTGRPYFVMELVKGIPITQFCDEAQLTTRERLELFVNVCQAAQHAHQKGIIHRDIKPTNVLVTLHDGAPVVKVIDFGVAKATGQQLTEKTLFTGFAQMVGTPLYMSPEQAALSGLDIDTRSDIYSLGVLLYELLTSTTPLHKERLKEAAFDEIRRIIREDEPVKPSTRISTLGATATSISALRKTEPHKLSQLLRNELDWIVMKALEKDRTRRYETASAFAADVGRYLRDEQVEACPPSALYRLKKFARRNRVAFTSAALVSAALFLGLIASATLAVIASRQRDRAELATRETEKARQEAEGQRDQAEKARQAESQQRRLAEASEQTALQEKNNALAAREELRHTLYASEMSLVQAAVEGKQYARAAQLLDQQRPATGHSDIRGFEWHYWQRRLRRGRLRSVEVPQLASTNSFATYRQRFSKGAARLAVIVDYPADSPSQTGLGLVALFNGVTGRELLPPFEPFPDQQAGGSRRLSLTMSDDGTLLAAAIFGRVGSTDSRVGYISLRDASTGSETRRIESPGNLTAIALTPDGSRLAVSYAEVGQPDASPQVGVKIWDTSTGELVQTLPMLPSSGSTVFNRILWSPDGARLVRELVTWGTIDDTQAYRSRIQTVDVASGEELWECDLSSPASAVRAWAFSPDGNLLVVADPRIAAKLTLQLWDSYTGRALAILDREAGSVVADATLDFTQDGQLLAVASAKNEIYVWELPKLPLAAGATPLHIAAPNLTLQTAGKAIQALAFSKLGRELHSVDAGTSLVTWDATAREDLGLGPDSSAGYFQAKISPDATKVAFIKSGPSPTGMVWDLAKDQEVCRLQLAGAFVGRPEFSPDGRRVALVQYASPPQEDPQIVIHDAQTGDVLTTIKMGQTIPSVRSFRRYFVEPIFRPDGSQIAALGHPIWPRGEQSGEPGPTRLMTWDAATGQQLLSVAIDAAINADELHYSLDGASLIIGSKVRPVAAAFFYDATTGERQRSISMPSSPTNYFINVPNQIFGAIVGSDFVFWDLATGQERLRLPGYSGISFYAISPDGSRIVLGEMSFSSNVSDLTLWSLKSGRRLLAFNRQGYLSAISFSPDGNRLVAAFSQSGPAALKPIQIWDATPLPEEVPAKEKAP